MSRNRFDCIKSIIKEFEDDILISLNNRMNLETGSGYYINNNEEGDLSVCFPSIDEALRAAYYGDYTYGDDYFIIDVYGNLKSFSGYDIDKIIDYDDLTNFVMDNDCDEIKEVWYDDVFGDFVDYLNEKLNADYDFDTVYDKVNETNLITEDWDEVIEKYFKD